MPVAVAVSNVGTRESAKGKTLVLWPMVVLHRLNVFLVVLPEVDGFPIARLPKHRPRAIQLPCVTSSFALLEALVSVIKPCAPNSIAISLPLLNVKSVA